MQSVSNFNLRGHQIINVLAEHVTNDAIPDAGTNEGRFLYNSDKKQLNYSNGTEWVNVIETKIVKVSNGVISINGTNMTVFSIAAGGDVTLNGSNQAMIGVNKVTNTHLAKMGANTLKGNNTSSAANAKDLTANEVLTMLGINLSTLNGKVSDVKVDGTSVVTSTVANIDLAGRLNTFKTSLKIGAANGLATLDAAGKVPSSQLPSYVDDVLEYDNKAAFPATGESGKIYVDKATNKTYRWSGTAYVEISASLAIGTTTGTAADGGVAKAHYDNTTIHITSAERTAWNAKQSTSVTLAAATSDESGIPTESSSKTITQWLQGAFNAIKSIKGAFNDHTHNGTNSQKINYNDLLNKPTIPDVSGFLKIDGSNGTAAGVSALVTKLSTDNTTPTDSTLFVTSGASVQTTFYRRSALNLWDYIKGKANSVYAAKSHTHTASQVTGLATVATSGSYNDLINKPKLMKAFKSAALTGTTGTITAATHGCGQNPLVQAFLNGELIFCDIKVATTGDITWAANEAFTASSNFYLVMNGIA